MDIDRPPAASVPAVLAVKRGGLARWAGPTLVLVIITLSGWVLHRELGAVHYQALAEQFHLISGTRIALAIGLALAAYAILPGYDLIALHAIGRPIPAHRVAFSSFIAYALSQTLGFPLLTGGSVRYRFWSTWGLDSAEIAAAMGYVMVTFTSASWRWPVLCSWRNRNPPPPCSICRFPRSGRWVPPAWEW